MTGFMVNGKETLLQTEYITKRADLPKCYAICWSFLERKNQERTKVNNESYKNMLEIGLLPDWRRLYPNGDWVFQEDGAPANRSKTTQEYLDGGTPDFIRKYEWPPQRPDCNPIDYAVWDSYAGKQDTFTEK